jgi:hypothetical protein
MDPRATAPSGGHSLEHGGVASSELKRAAGRERFRLTLRFDRIDEHLQVSIRLIRLGGIDARVIATEEVVDGFADDWLPVLIPFPDHAVREPYAEALDVLGRPLRNQDGSTPPEAGEIP